MMRFVSWLNKLYGFQQIAVEQFNFQPVGARGVTLQLVDLHFIITFFQRTGCNPYYGAAAIYQTNDDIDIKIALYQKRQFWCKRMGVYNNF